MAAVVKTVYASPQCKVDLTYDDVTFRASQLRVEVFPGVGEIRIFAIRESDGTEFGRVFTDGVDTINLPGGGNAITVTINERGGVNEFAFGSNYPI